MANSQLHFLGHIVDILSVSTVYRKNFSKNNGAPILYNEGGLLKIVFDFESNFSFLERMNTVDFDLYKRGYPVDNGKIVFYKPNGELLKVWPFKDAVIVYFHFKFDVNGGGLKVEMKLSPAIQDYGCKIHRSWHISPIEDESYQPPVKNNKRKEKKLRKYKINKTGHITLYKGKTENVGKYDILINLKGEEIKIYNTSILPQLVKKQRFSKTTVSMAKVSASDKKDLAKIFLFAANNSTSEWIMIKTKKNVYILGTKFDSGYSPSSLALGLTGDNEINVSIHSHPNIYIKPGDTRFQSEKKSMGYGINENLAWGDWGQTVVAVENNGMKYPFKNYVYIP